MSLAVQGLFFFSAVGAFNGLIAGLFILLFYKKENLSSYFLGILLTMVSIRIGKSAIYFFAQDIPRSFLQVGLTACYFIGPTLYYYIRTALNKTSQLKKQAWVHMAILLFLPLVPGVIFPYAEYPHIWGQYIWHLINLQLTVYILITAYELRSVFKKYFSSAKLEKNERWPLIIFTGNLIVCLANVISLFTTYILGSLSFSLVFYSSLFILVSKDRKLLSRRGTEKKPHGKEQEAAAGLIKKLEAVMNERQLYKQQNLKMAEVASAMRISPHQLSRLVNEHLNKSFSQLISEYRVAETCRLLRAEPNYTLEAIGYDAGFSSKSTFFTTFKKVMGKTPAQYKEATSSTKRD